MGEKGRGGGGGEKRGLNILVFFGRGGGEKGSVLACVFSLSFPLCIRREVRVMIPLWRK